MEFMPKIQVLEGPMERVQLEIDKEVMFVGRSDANDIKIRDETVSRKHLKIFSVESCYFVEDLKSRNGTMINGETLDAGFARLITENDRLQLGSTVIHLDGIGVNKPPITVKEIEPDPLEKVDRPESPKAYLGGERRSRVLLETNFVYDLLQFLLGRPHLNQLFAKVTKSLFESYPRISRVIAFLFDNEKNRMEQVVSLSRKTNGGRPSAYTKAILDQAVKDGKIVTNYFKEDAMRDGFTNAQDTVAFTTVICLPLMNGEKVRGVISIEGFPDSNPVRQEDFLQMKTIKCLLELGCRQVIQEKE
jgi:pSer/pThr/pTyr-binding forkhead associated (FHA) protein